MRHGVVDALELGDAERRLQVRQPQVAAQLLVQEASSLPEAEIAERAQTLGEGVVVGQHHAALTGRDQLVGVEAEGAQRPEAAAAPPRRARGRATREVFGAVRFGGVLDDREAVRLGELEHRVHVDRVAVDVDGHDRPRARADPRRDLDPIHAPRLRIAVDEHGYGARVQHRADARDDRERRQDHLVARLELECGDRGLERRGAVADGDRRAGVRSTPPSPPRTR